jgi:hypothetical protein
MYEVLLGESHITITENLRVQLGWSGGCDIAWLEPAPERGRYEVFADRAKYKARMSSTNGPGSLWPDSALLRKGLGWFFSLPIPGVSRGRLRGSRTCKFSIEGVAAPKVLILDTRE